MHSQYCTTGIRELCDQQVRFAPRHKKIEQAAAAEKLLSEIDLERSYTYEYLCFRITTFRPEVPRSLISGSDVCRDLRLFIEDLTDSADIRAEDVQEPVYTVEELSQRFNVSSKTISRWRQHGLVSRRFIYGGRKRVAFLQSSVDRFVARNPERVKRGQKFSQLTEQERNEIIDRARRLAQAGSCNSEITRRIASHVNRSVETIRYTLKQFDEKNPDAAIFPTATGRLTPETKQQIHQRYRRGTSVTTLGKQYNRTPSSIHRIINEVRGLRILELPLDCMHNEVFDKPKKEKEILGPLPVNETASKKVRPPAGLPHYLAALYEVPLLNREQEGHLFRKYNYLKYKAAKLREKLEPARAKSSIMDEIEDLYGAAVAIKNQIVQANLRLVVSIAKRHVSANQDFFSLVSDGNMSLIRAVEKFDYARGNKFSTYASWAIMKNFARTIPGEHKQLDRFRTSQDDFFTSQHDDRTNQYMLESAQQQRQHQIGNILSELDEREQRIIISRFGLDHSIEPQTLKEVGRQLGVTKERVRQIEARAISKLRVAAQHEKIDIPDGVH